MKNCFLTWPTTWLSESKYILYLRMLTLIFSIKNQDYRVYNIISSSNPRIWKLIKKSEEIYIQSPFRASRFLKGFDYAALKIWHRYGISKLLNGIIPKYAIDAGANIGEFSRACQLFQIKTIFAIEPDEIPYQCLMLNINSNVMKHKLLLNKSNSISSFYVSSTNADSSLIKPKEYTDIVNIRGVTLDSFIKSHNIGGEVLLKLDAEGAEPEVIGGLLSEISKVKWIAVDVGPEREGVRTYTEVSNMLISKGYNVNRYNQNILHAVLSD